jgi:hypothetical protein
VKRANLGNLLAACVLCLAALPGCESVPKCPPGVGCNERPGCLEIPGCSRNRTYVFLIDGLDPLCQMDVLREGLIEAGFIKVYSGPRPLCWHYAKEIQRLHEEDEDARFVIVAQGSASGAARTIADRAGTPISLVVLLDDTGEGPVNAEHVLFVCGEKDKVKDDRVAEITLRLADAGVLGVASHPQTAKLIASRLCAIAGTIPVAEVGPKCDVPDCMPCGGGWDFLRPDGHDSGYVGCKPMNLAANSPPATELMTLPAPQPEDKAKPRTLPMPKLVPPANGKQQPNNQQAPKATPSSKPVVLPPPPVRLVPGQP